MTGVIGLHAAIDKQLGSRVLHARPLSGGDVAESFRVDLDDGRRVFAKTHPSPPPGFFATESDGLAWITDSGSVRTPAVLAVQDEPELAFLVLEWIDEGAALPSTEADFGRALASLHRSGAPTFGRLDGATTGSRKLPNEPCGSWAEFYGTQRLQPLARLARDANTLSPDTLSHVDRLVGRLGGFDDGEAPSRLHGDLWAGNRLIDHDGRSVLIDPAAHGGHREFDLAMMQLFGGFGDAAFASYDEVHPLSAGCRERVALHQIAPLMVHAIKFGGGYVAAADAAIRAFS